MTELPPTTESPTQGCEQELGFLLSQLDKAEQARGGDYSQLALTPEETQQHFELLDKIMPCTLGADISYYESLENTYQRIVDCSVRGGEVFPVEWAQQLEKIRMYKRLSNPTHYVKHVCDLYINGDIFEGLCEQWLQEFVSEIMVSEAAVKLPLQYQGFDVCLADIRTEIRLHKQKQQSMEHAPEVTIQDTAEQTVSLDQVLDSVVEIYPLELGHDDRYYHQALKELEQIFKDCFSYNTPDWYCTKLDHLRAQYRLYGRLSNPKLYLAYTCLNTDTGFTLHEDPFYTELAGVEIIDSFVKEILESGVAEVLPEVYNDSFTALVNNLRQSLNNESDVSIQATLMGAMEQIFGEEAYEKPQPTSFYYKLCEQICYQAQRVYKKIRSATVLQSDGTVVVSDPARIVSVRSDVDAVVRLIGKLTDIIDNMPELPGREEIQEMLQDKYVLAILQIAVEYVADDLKKVA